MKPLFVFSVYSFVYMNISAKAKYMLYMWTKVEAQQLINLIN